MKSRHEAEIQALESELDRQRKAAARLETEVDSLRGRVSEAQRRHDAILVETSNEKDRLHSELAEKQRQLAQAVSANRAMVAAETGIADPVKEICELKSHLAAVTLERNELKKRANDLTVR